MVSEVVGLGLLCHVRRVFGDTPGFWWFFGAFPLAIASSGYRYSSERSAVHCKRLSKKRFLVAAGDCYHRCFLNDVAVFRSTRSIFCEFAATCFGSVPTVFVVHE